MNLFFLSFVKRCKIVLICCHILMRRAPHSLNLHINNIDIADDIVDEMEYYIN